MRIERVFTTVGSSPYDGIGFRTATSEIRNPDGSVVFRLDEIEVPSAWSQVAVDVLAQKYFRKAGIATRLVAVDEPDVPAWLQRRRPDQAALDALPETERYGGETSARQVFDRLAGTWTWWGWKGGYFDSEADAQSVLRRAPLHARLPVRRPQLAAVVQYRPELGLWHRRPGARPLLRRRPRPARSSARSRPTSGRSRTPASSRASRTTWSIRAASWISGCARRACSNMAPAPAPTSRACAARTSRYRAAASRPA